MAAVEAADGDSGGEAPDLDLPVAQQGGGTDDQGRPRPLLGTVEVQGDQGHRLAEPHVVGQAGTQAQGRDPLEPGEALPLVVAQRRRQAGRRRERRGGRGVEQLLADLEQAGADHHLGRGVVDVDDTGQRRGHGLSRLHGPDQPVAGLAGDRRVDDRPAAAQPEHRRGRRGERRHLRLGQRVTAQRQLPVEGEQGLAAEHALDQLTLAPARDPVEGGRRLQVAAQAARPQHVDTRGVQRLHAVLEETDQLVGGQRQLVGDPLLEQTLQRRPGSCRVAQGQGGVGASAVAEAVDRRGVAPQRGRVADVQRVLLVVHLEHEAAGAGDELLLVGLHPQREGDQLGQVGGVTAMTGDERLEAAAERLRLGPARGRRGGRPTRGHGGRCRGGGGGPGGRGRGGRGGARHGVDDGVHEPAYEVLRVGRRQPGVRPRLGQPPESLAVVGVEGREPPHPVTRLELAGRDEAHREQRGRRQQAHRRMGLLVGPGLRQHRQRGPDRQRDGPGGRGPVGELDQRVPWRVGAPQGRRTGERHEAHPDLPSRRPPRR